MTDKEYIDIRDNIRKSYLYKKKDINNYDYIKGGLSEYIVSLLTIDKDDGHVILHMNNEFNITFYLGLSLKEFEKRFDKVNI